MKYVEFRWFCLVSALNIFFFISQMLIIDWSITSYDVTPESRIKENQNIYPFISIVKSNTYCVVFFASFFWIVQFLILPIESPWLYMTSGTDQLQNQKQIKEVCFTYLAKGSVYLKPHWQPFLNCVLQLCKMTLKNVPRQYIVIQ